MKNGGKTRLYIGSFGSNGGRGIVVCDWDGSALSLAYEVVPATDATYLILSEDRQTLYAVTREGRDGEPDGSVAAYRVLPDGLEFASRQDTGGTSTCHLTLDAFERYLYVANYGSGSLAVFPVKGDQIGERIQRIEHKGSGPNPLRQASAHVHQVLFRPGTRQLFVCDLGMDAVMVYEQDEQTGHLRYAQRIDVPPGLGPRHLLFDDEGRVFYLLCELGNVVLTFREDAGSWHLSQTLSTLPEGFSGESYAAALWLYEGILYASNRGHDSLAAFAIGEDAALSPVGIHSVAGKWPRDFHWLEDGTLIVACQKGGGLRAMKRRPDGGYRTCAVLPLAGCVSVCEIKARACNPGSF